MNDEQLKAHFARMPGSKLRALARGINRAPKFTKDETTKQAIGHIAQIATAECNKNKWSV